MQAPFDLPADLFTPVSAYLKLAPLHPRFLLESAAGPERAARYSFLGFGAVDELVLDARGWTQNGHTQPAPATRRELLERLRRALADAPELCAAGSDGRGERELSFHGGLVGVLGYELVRRFERERPAAPHRAPNPHPDLHLFAPRALLVFDHQRRSAALLSAGSESERAALRREVRALLAGPLPERPGGRRSDAPRARLSREDFVARVKTAQEAIQEGEVYQLVLSSAFEGRTDLDAIEIYRALRLTNPSPYMVLLELGELAVIGASPEALVRVEHGRATLQPIAGTRPRGRDGEHDRALEAELLADEKEAAEHVMLVDLARNDLGRVAVPGTIAVEPFRSVERYSHVMHLTSGVTGLLAPEHDAFELLAACFPAGTVVGAPKVRARELIDELEPEARGLYGGTVGYFGQGGAMDQALLIRTLFLEHGSYRYQAGAGIVAQSSPTAEYDEVLAKGAALARALELAAEGLS